MYLHIFYLVSKVTAKGFLRDPSRHLFSECGVVHQEYYRDVTSVTTFSNCIIEITHTYRLTKSFVQNVTVRNFFYL
jgi:hypothetical protein